MRYRTSVSLMSILGSRLTEALVHLFSLARYPSRMLHQDKVEERCTMRMLGSHDSSNILGVDVTREL